MKKTRMASMPIRMLMSTSASNSVFVAFPIQNVNAYSSRLKRRMVRLHSMATKYPINYLG
ncbi:hypothetical protein SAMN05216190_14320 [Pseudomonas borbori]|uniref:Uncharacterized protein n=1 Tax=Pseudomonas borbori TaxID=289003 RepID=A0A1I5WSU1_9PSED|nr:hypothetical protein SAMN05216190_14320 [Pseudomonas borbori]